MEFVLLQRVCATHTLDRDEEMKFNFENLNLLTRQKMLEEVNRDIENNNLYMSKRFNENGINLLFVF